MQHGISRRWTAVAALVALVAAGSGRARAEAAAPARGGDENRLSSMEDRITALEDQLRESQEIIKKQQDELKAQGSTDVAGKSIDAFLKSVHIGGHVAASYGYNLNRPRFTSGTNTLCQFNCNSQEFSFDAAKLNLSKPASEPGSAGFQLDLLYGQNASILNNGSPATDNDGIVRKASDQQFFVEQAFAAYNLGGVTFKAGKFDTLLGYEVLDTDQNPNVTHGVLFTSAIPAVHTGLMAGGNFSETMSWAAGVVNGSNNTRSFSSKKGFVGKLAWSSGAYTAQLTSYTGTFSGTRVALPAGALSPSVITDPGLGAQIWDGILQYALSENSKVWANADLGRTHGGQNPGALLPAGSGSARWFGVAAGWKQQITDKLFFALRGEWMNDPQASRFGALGFNADQSLQNATSLALLRSLDVYTGTVTLGYQVAPNIQARLEFRHDYVRCAPRACNFFFNSNATSSTGANRKTNNLAVLQLVYSFE
jgi:hypothetical protein